MRAQWERRAEKFLAGLDAATSDWIYAAVADYVETGRGDVLKLKGRYAGLRRLKVGDWRVYFRRERDLLTIEEVINRRDAYR